MKKKILSVFVGLGLAISTCLPMKTSALTTQETLENLVLSHSEKNQTLMFGEKHGEYRKDSDFVISILPELKEQGFEYLALEHERNPSGDLEFLQIFSDYIDGKIKREDLDSTSLWIEQRYAAGWFDLVDAAKDVGMKIISYDATKGEYSTFDEREEIAFDNIKDMIFDKDHDAKVIVYSGLAHINERPIHDQEYVGWEEKNNLKKDEDGEYICLAFHLDQYTKGKTFTVSLAGPYDYKPPFCDLILFTLDIYQNSPYQITKLINKVLIP